MLHPSHNPALVILSVVVACIASYAALQLAGRVVAARRIRLPWLLGSAFTMGIWTDDQLRSHDRTGAEVVFLPKPFESKALTAAVRAALDAPATA